MADNRLVLSLEVTDNGVVRVVRQVRDEIADLSRLANAAGQQMHNLGVQAAQAGRELGGAQTNAAAFNQGLSQASQTAANLAHSLNSAAAAANQLGGGGGGRGGGGGGISGLTSGLGLLRGTIDGVGKAFLYLNQAWELGIKLMHQFTKLFNAVVETGAAFQQHIAHISTLYFKYEDAQKAVRQFTTEIKGMLGVLPVSADDLGAAAYEIVSAGITDTARAFKILEEGAKLGVAGLGTTEQAVDVLTSAINSYGLRAEEVAKVSNTFFLTVLFGKTKIEDLVESFGRVAPLAKAAGVGIDELSAATAALTQAGLKTSDAQIYLRQSVNALLKPTATMTQMLERMKEKGDQGAEGFNKMREATGRAALEAYGYIGTLQKLSEAADGSDVALTKAYGRVQATTSSLALTGPMLGAYNMILTEMRENVGALDNAYDKASGTWARSVDMLASAWDRVKIAIFALFEKYGTAYILSFRDALLDLAEGAEQMGDPFEVFATETLPGVISSIANLGNMIVQSIPQMMRYGSLIVGIIAATKIAAAGGGHPLALLGGAGAGAYITFKGNEYADVAEEDLKGLQDLFQKMSDGAEAAAQKAAQSLKENKQVVAAAVDDFTHAWDRVKGGESSRLGMSILPEGPLINQQDNKGMSTLDGVVENAFGDAAPSTARISLAPGADQSAIEDLWVNLQHIKDIGAEFTPEMIRAGEAIGFFDTRVKSLAESIKATHGSMETTSEILDGVDDAMKDFEKSYALDLDTLKIKAEGAQKAVKDLLDKGLGADSAEVKAASAEANAAVQAELNKRRELLDVQIEAIGLDKDWAKGTAVEMQKRLDNLIAKRAELLRQGAATSEIDRDLEQARERMAKKAESDRKKSAAEEKREIEELANAKKGAANSLVALRKQELDNLVAQHAPIDVLIAKAHEVDAAEKARLLTQAKILDGKKTEIRAQEALGQISHEVAAEVVADIDNQIKTLEAASEIANDSVNAITKKWEDGFEKITLDVPRMWRDAMSDSLATIADGSRKMSDVWKGLKQNMQKSMWDAFDAIIFGKKRKLDDPMQENLDGIGGLFSATANDGMDAFGGLFGSIIKGAGSAFSVVGDFFSGMFGGGGGGGASPAAVVSAWGGSGISSGVVTPGTTFSTPPPPSGTSRGWFGSIGEWFSGMFSSGGGVSPTTSSSGITPGGGGLLGNIGGYVSKLFSGATSLFGGGTGGGWMSSLFDGVKDSFGGIGRWLQNFVNPVAIGTYGANVASIAPTAAMGAYPAGYGLASPSVLNGSIGAGGIQGGSSATTSTGLLSSGMSLTQGLSAIIGIVGMVLAQIDPEFFQNKTEAKIAEYGSMVPVVGGFAYAGPIINKMGKLITGPLGIHNQEPYYAMMNPLMAFIQSKTSERDLLRRAVRKTFGPMIAAAHPDLFTEKQGKSDIVPDPGGAGDAFGHLLGEGKGNVLSMTQRLGAGLSTSLSAKVLALLFLGNMSKSPLASHNKENPNINNRGWLGSYNTASGQIQALLDKYPDMAETFARDLFRGLSGGVAEGVRMIQRAMLNVIKQTRRGGSDETQQYAYDRLTGKVDDPFNTGGGKAGGLGISLMPTFEEAIKEFLRSVLASGPRAIREGVGKLVDDEFARVRATEDPESTRAIQNNGFGLVDGDQIQRLLEIQQEAYVDLVAALSKVAVDIENNALTNKQAVSALNSAFRETLGKKAGEELTNAFFGSRSMENILAPFLTTLNRGVKQVLDAGSQYAANEALGTLMAGLGNDIIRIQENVRRMIPLMRQYNELMLEITLAMTTFDDVKNAAKAGARSISDLIAEMDGNPDKQAQRIIEQSEEQLKEQARIFKKRTGIDLFAENGTLISHSKQDIAAIVHSLTDKQLKQMPEMLARVGDMIAANAKAQIDALNASMERARAWAAIFQQTQDTLIGIRQVGRPAGETAEALYETSRQRVDDLITKFRTGTKDEKLAAAQELLQAGPELLARAVEAGILPGSKEFELLRGGITAVLEKAQDKAAKADQEVREIQEQIREIQHRSLDELKEIRRQMVAVGNEAKTREDIIRDIEENTGPAGPVMSTQEISERTYDLLNRGINVAWGKKKYDSFGSATGDETDTGGSGSSKSASVNSNDGTSSLVFGPTESQTTAFQQEPATARSLRFGSGEDALDARVTVEVPVVYQGRDNSSPDLERVRAIEQDMIRALGNVRFRSLLMRMVREAMARG